MNRCVQIFVLTAVFSANFGNVAWGQNADSTPAVSDRSEPIADSREPEIPLNILRTYALQLRSDEQSEPLKTAITEFYKQGADSTRKIAALREALGGYSIENPRLRVALTKAETDADNQVANQFLSVLTEEQKSSIRRKHRGAIQQEKAMAAQTAASSATYIGSDSVCQLLQRDDLLSVVRIPNIQDRLLLTDEQFEVVEKLSRDAEADAANVISDCLTMLAAPSSASAPAAPTPSVAYMNMDKATQAILTEEQRNLYRKHYEELAARMKEVASNPERHEEFATLAKQLRPHGAVDGMEVNTVNGKTEARFEFYNFFAVRETSKKLNISEEQQTAIAAAMEDFRVAVAAENQKQNDERAVVLNEGRQKVAARVRQHNMISSTEIVTLLTEIQKAILEKERIRSLGIGMFVDQKVVTALGLSDDQKKQVAEILSRRPEGIQQPPIHMASFSKPMPNADPKKQMEEFRKRSEESSRLFQENSRLHSEHIQKQTAEIWKLLTEEQTAALKEIAGFPTAPPNF